MAGFERGRKLDKVGQEESDTAELFFTDVRVPDANRIGEVDRGFIAMMERLPQERIGAAVSNTAHAQQILVETIDYAKQRKAFGQPIGAFQHNKFLIAELLTKIEVTQAYVDVCVAGAPGAPADRGGRREGQVVVGGGAERRAGRAACSCTAATGT